MNKYIHEFSQNKYSKDTELKKYFGIRGQQAMDFAALGLPILPGFVIDSRIAAHLEEEDIHAHLKDEMKKIENITGKVFDNPENPLLLKIVVSPNLAIVQYPALHNYGLTSETIPGFNAFVGKSFGYHEVLFMIRGQLEIEEKIAELEGDTQQVENIQEIRSSISTDMKKVLDKKTDPEKIVEGYKRYFSEEFFADGYSQVTYALKRISRMLDLDELDEDDAAILLQPMVYGNYGKDSASGYFYTRNIVTGKKTLEGEYFQNKFDSIGTSGKDINKIDKTFLQSLEEVARTVEDHFKEIRVIRYTIENKKLWLIDQRSVMTKSTQADIQTLLDLRSRKIIKDSDCIKAIKPDQLNEILHPIVDIASVKNLKKIEGGIAGAPGAAIGRIYFSTDSLLDAFKNALQTGEDTRFILCMDATFAEDVKAIEIATGVLSSEGGYSAHASVVARQYGKVSLVNTKMRIAKKQATIGKTIIKEGDFITLNVPHYGDPQIYLGKSSLIEPDPKKSGLLEYIDIVKNFVTNDFNVRVNADTPRDAALALKFGAAGIGLCRTEHMFFADDRINVFREMVICESTEERKKTLAKLKNMQKKDFLEIFKTMEEREVTIRLLDAPLHEFLPHNKDEMDAFIKYLKGPKGTRKVSPTSIKAICASLEEFNPMLGHRGCRIAVSYPEIYEMQVQAIFEAAYELQTQGKKVQPEIMIPLIMNASELRLIIYGKKIEGDSRKGIIEVAEEVENSKSTSKTKAKKIDYTIGTMIELPAAALHAGDISRYAEFFSFGTNDLTQTTIGLSRDDFNSFMPDYTQFDILAGNPFQVLDDSVKELIQTAVKRGTMTRPGLKKGLCGEHGAIPENIKFCIETGLDYVSCSVYSVPIANLAVAQYNLEREQ